MPRLSAAIAIVAVFLSAMAAEAQSERGAIVSGSVAATVLGSGTEPSVSGAVSYRMNRVLGFGIEATWLPSVTSDLGGMADSPYLAIFVRPGDGDAVFFTTNMRLEIPTQSTRIVPFVVGGGGVASFTHRYGLSFTDPPSYPSLPVLNPPSVIDVSLRETIQNSYSSSSTNLMLTLGGGVSLLMTQHVALDIDLRTIYVRGQQSNGTIGRFAVGASYRF
jgi:opacity protein-like surface antigen